MYKGIYIALSGAMLKQRQLETLSQNVANATTTGFRKETLSFRDHLVPQDSPNSDPDGRVMAALSSQATDFSQGQQIRTGNPLDIAIEGDGLLALEGDRYTRRGDLHRDREGYLVTHGGAKVMGGGGPVQLPEDAVQITIDPDGNLEVDGVQLDTLRVVRFASPSDLGPAGDGMFTAKAPGEPVSGSVLQGHLESSNVNVVAEMVRMITAQREFESYQKVIHAMDEATAKVNNELGRI